MGAKASGPPQGGPSRALSKDECVALALRYFQAAHDGIAWSEPRFTPAPEGVPASGYAWRVPTSLFFGLRAVRLGDGAEENTAKRRRELRLSVRNLAEAREQIEAFREDVYTGIVLRGDDSFGWASSPSDLTTLPAALFRCSTEPELVRAGEAAACVQRHATQLLALLDAGGGHVNGRHRAQLEEAARGAQPHLSSELDRALAADPTSEFAFCARAYGGGPWRLALTLSCVADRLGLRAFSVPEQFGDGSLVFSPSTAAAAGGGDGDSGSARHASALLGAELRADGSASYIRLQLADTAPGDTHRCL